jgi:methylglutaconyl-CoA hydratase
VSSLHTSEFAAHPAGYVERRVTDGIASVRFGHPKGNSLPAAVLRDLAAAIGEVAAHDEVRLIVVSSFGDGPFCGGASFDELTAIADEASGKEFFMGFARVILAMTRARQPILTRVQGKVVGGGVGVVAASDYVVATENASLRLSEVALGIGPFVVGPAIERKVGVGAFAGMAIDGEWRDARWGESHGLYATVYDTTKAMDGSLEIFARTMAALNPDALSQIKRITWAGTDHWPTLLEERAALSGRLVLSEYTRAAIAAFRGRR